MGRGEERKTLALGREHVCVSWEAESVLVTGLAWPNNNSNGVGAWAGGVGGNRSLHLPALSRARSRSRVRSPSSAALYLCVCAVEVVVCVLEFTCLLNFQRVAQKTKKSGRVRRFELQLILI